MTARILLIEDNPLDAELIAELLELADGDYAVERHARLEPAMDSLRQRSFDVVLLDLRLPDAEGVPALRRLLAEANDTPIVVLTGMDDRQLAAACIEAGAADYVEKDALTTRQLERSLRYAAARGRARALERELQQRHQLALLGELAAGLAHDVKNPAAILLAQLDLVAAHLATPTTERDDADAADLIDQCRAQVERITSLTQRLGMFAGSHGGLLQDVDLAERCRLVVAATESVIRSRGRVRLVTEEGLPKLRLDAGKLDQVLLHLVLHAAQTLPADGAGEVTISCSQRDDEVQLAVKAHMLGDDTRNAEACRDASSTPTSAVSRGLGLEICMEVASTLGGRLAVGGSRNEPRHVLHLPAAPPRVARRSQRPSLPPGKARVLVVDDEAALSRAVERMLSRRFAVTTAAGGREALELLEQSSFDVILCDLTMPAMDGATFFEAVQRHDPELAERFIFMSGGAITERTRKFARTCPRLFLDKPLKRAQLLAAVAEMAETE